MLLADRRSAMAVKPVPTQPIQSAACEVWVEKKVSCSGQRMDLETSKRDFVRTLR